MVLDGEVDLEREERARQPTAASTLITSSAPAPAGMPAGAEVFNIRTL